jgi:hypothetical protein
MNESKIVIIIVSIHVSVVMGRCRILAILYGILRHSVLYSWSKGSVNYCRLFLMNVDYCGFPPIVAEVHMTRIICGKFIIVIITIIISCLSVAVCGL